ncbi:MAG: hypothetical protein R2708_12275 [Vicinamibacterales bacterium]
MRAIRRHIIVRIVTCLLLTWAAADLLVPQLCSSEEVQASGNASGQDRDDCFCCCAHTEKAVTVAVTFSIGVPVVVDAERVDDLPSGEPRTLYHPPLLS